MKKLIALFIVLAITTAAVPAHAWPMFSKPEYRGRVIDADTNEPLEGVVVVVVYEKMPYIGHAGGRDSYPIEAKETLTDKKGEFYFPAYHAFTPFSEESFTLFYFFKPGYMRSDGPPIGNRVLVELFFSSDQIGKVGEIRDGEFDRWKGSLGILKLRKARTDEEKLDSVRIYIPSINEEDLPLLQKAHNEATQNLKREGLLK